MTKDPAQRAAIEAFQRALAAGAERKAAMDVALAKYRALRPDLPEFHVRKLLGRLCAPSALERLPAHSRRLH